MTLGISPFSLQHVSPTLAEQVRSSVWDRTPEAFGLPVDDAPPPGPSGPSRGRARPRVAGVLEPVAGLAITLAGGAFMAVLAVPAYLGAYLAAKADPELRHGMPAHYFEDDAAAE